MWKLPSMRAALSAVLGIVIGFSCSGARGRDLEPGCLSSPTEGEVRWTRGPEGDCAQLDSWCAAVGPPVLRPAPREVPDSRNGELAIVVWNIQLGAGAVESLVSDLRAGRLTDGRPVRHFALLLQEVHRDLRGALAIAPPGSRAARRIAPKQRGLDVVSLARDLDLHLFYVPSMRNGAEDRPAEDRGNAIVSTLPLRDPWALELPLERERRVAVAARVQLGPAGDDLLLVSAHLDNRSSWRRGPRSFGWGRTGQARWLADALVGELAVALGGDFNTWLRGADAGALRLLHQSFPLPEVLPGRPTLIVPLFPDREVDHLFARLPAGWKLGTRVVETSYGSDHRPLLGSLRPSPLGDVW